MSLAQAMGWAAWRCHPMAVPPWGDSTSGILQALLHAFLGHSKYLPLSFWHSCPPSRGMAWATCSKASGNAHFPSHLWPPMCKHHLKW